MAHIENFREQLVERRSNWMKRYPDYTIQEATAAVALESARCALNDMTLSGKRDEAIDIIMSGELPRRVKLIETTAAYEKYGIRLKKIMDSFEKNPSWLDE